MKSRALKLGLCITVFFFLLVASFALVRPIYIGLGNAMRSKIDELNSTLDESFRINVSYSSLSPSILTGINIKNIVVKDTETDEVVLTIKKARADYSFVNILKGDYKNGISKIIIRDLYAEIIRGSQSTWLEYTLEKNVEKEQSQKIKVENKTIFDILSDSEINLDIPFDIFINNLNVVYRDTRNKIQLTAALRKVFVERTLTKGKYSVDLSGKLSGDIKSNTFSTNIFLQSSLLSKINNSSAVINFFNTNFNSYSINQIGFLSEYEDSVFVFKMLPTFQNIYLELSANVKTKDINCRFDSNNFKINNVLAGIKKGSVIDTVSNLVISASMNVAYNLETEKIKYSASGDVDIPNSLIRGGLNLSFALNGDRYYVNVPYINGTGELYDVNFSGGYNINAIQPQGILSVNKIVLENEGQITAEFYFEPLKRGFMAFSPQIMLDDKVFTAAQLNFIPQRDGFDFDFDIYDYSHIDSGAPGVLTLSGNYLTASKFFQSNINVDGFYVDSLMETVAFFLDKNRSGFVNDTSKMFKNTIFSTAVYVSSYNNNFSYSIPSVIIADTKSDSKMLMLALDGNKENIQLTKFELVFDDQKIMATAHSENMYEVSTRQNQTVVTGQVEYNTIPYTFTGLISKDWITVTGDYGFSFSFMNDKETDNLLGSFALDEFPLKFENTTFSISADTNFFYNLNDKLNINVSKFNIQSFNPLTQNTPTFAFVGNVDKNGTFLQSITYKDSSSNLSGNGSVVWNFNDSDFTSASYSIYLADPFYNESLKIEGDVSNPDNKPLTAKSFLNDFYYSSFISLKDFRTGRFFGDAFSNDTMNAELSLSGALTNPLVSLSVPNGKFTINNVPVNFSIQASIVDLEFELTKASLEWGNLKINDITSKLSLNDWIGTFDCNVDTVFMDRTLMAPFHAEFKGFKNELSKKFVPESFELDLICSKPSGTFVKSQQEISIKALKTAEEILISSSPNLGLTGSINEYGDVRLSVNNNIPCKFDVATNIKQKYSDLRISDVNIDLDKMLKLVDFKMAKIYNGTLTGEFAIVGSKNTRQFDGHLQIIPAEFSMPEFFTAHARTDVINIYMGKDLIYIPTTRCMVRRSPVDVSVNINFKKMVLDFVTVNVRTVNDTYAPVNINLNQIHVKGNGQLDLEIVVDTESVTVTGDITAKDTTAEFGTSTFNDVVNTINNSNETNENSLGVQVMLDVKMQKRVQVYYSSFLRGLVVPGSEVIFSYDSAYDKMILSGDVPLRSGEIIYLNSSFYIKEGRIIFSEEDDGIDPYVSLKAETRERDSMDNEVTIALQVEHQKLSQLTPKLTSSPARSEKEIMEILGNFVTGNSDNAGTFGLAIGDYALQTMVMRRVENALRDFLNFDILSIRTMVVQNALKYSISRDSERQGVNISNFFDNTTVYIGKYFGNAIYADALLRLSYNKNRINDASTLQGLVFKPEIGLEMEAPFANIRWSLAPDLSEIARNNIVIIPALTLSWKFNY